MLANFPGITDLSSIPPNIRPEIASFWLRFEHRLKSRAILWLLVLLPAVTAGPQAHGLPALASDTPLSREGYFVLRWEPTPPVQGFAPPLYLQQAPTPDFRNIQQWDVKGLTQATQSGLGDGRYYFRLHDGDSTGPTTMVEVRHHALSRALQFFFGGMAVFSVLLSSLYLGHHRQDRAT